MKNDLAPTIPWCKSSYSSNQGQCVEVAGLPGGRAVRDSKNPDGAVLIFGAAQWAAFTAAVRDGQI